MDSTAPGPQSAGLLEGLNDAQRAAVASTASPLCVLAGAGSGKTRVLTRRIAWRVAQGDAHPGHVLALTFTRKAAGELNFRLGSLGIRDRVAAGTFHSTAYAQLRRWWADRDQAAPGLLDRKVRVLAGLVPRAHRDAKPVEAVDLAGEIEWAKARMIGPDDYALEAEGAGRRPPLTPSRMAEIYRRYEEEKHRRGLVDFDDLLSMCARAIEEDAGFAAAQRWRFRHLFVDEFQDVNPSQFRLLSAWLGDRLDLCVVGDPNQAIYSWNGADPTLLTSFTDRFPTAEVINLEDNYRSTPQILTVAGAVLGRTSLRANRAEGPIPAVRSYGSDVEEARGVASLVRQARRPGSPWSDIAILARTNAQLPTLERALRALQVPSRTAGGAALLEQPEVKVALRQMSQAPPGATFLAVVADLEQAAGDDAGPLDASALEERRMQLVAFAQLAREYAALDQRPSAGGFRSWLTTTIGGDGGAGASDAVALSTFHRAKGLEWPVVFLVGLERGLVPIGRSNGPAEEAEERRLLYVAATRAEHRLHCSWAERRSFGQRSLPRQPSPYLEAIEMACLRLEGKEVPAADHAGGISRARSALPAPGRRPVGSIADLAADADPGVLNALRQWRSITAKASGVPAYVIFHDSTLAAMAASCPTTTKQLLGLPGLGPVKVSRYGDAILALVAEHRASA